MAGCSRGTCTRANPHWLPLHGTRYHPLADRNLCIRWECFSINWVHWSSFWQSLLALEVFPLKWDHFYFPIQKRKEESIWGRKEEWKHPGCGLPHLGNLHFTSLSETYEFTHQHSAYLKCITDVPPRTKQYAKIFYANYHSDASSTSLSCWTLRCMKAYDRLKRWQLNWNSNSYKARTTGVYKKHERTSEL